MNNADRLWQEHQEERRVAKQEREDWKNFQRSLAPGRKKDESRCHSCGRHWGCNCYPLSAEVEDLTSPPDLA